MTPNGDLFVRVLAQIEREPAAWVQKSWRCETGMCFAGWTTQLSGLRWIDTVSSSVTFDGRSEHCSAAAAVLLGVAENVLDSDGVNALDDGLFNGFNTLGDLYRISAEILGVAEVVLRDKVAAEVADGAVQ